MAKQAASGASKSDAVRKYLTANPKAGAKVAQNALKEQGIEVSIPLINKIKYAKPEGGEKKPAGAGRRGRPAGRGGNMSGVIRTYIQSNPNATRPEIRDALRAQGHNVSTSLVNAVYMKVQSAAGKPIKAARRGRPAGSKNKAKPGRPAGRPVGRPVGRPAASAAPAAAPKASGSSLSASDLISAKRLVDQIGGVDRMKQALALLEQLS